VENAGTLAANLVRLGYDVLTGGTDNHLMLMDVSKFREGLTGQAVQKALEECGVVVDMIRLPYEKKGEGVCGGIRLGTPIVTRNGMGTNQMNSISGLMDTVIRAVEIISDTEYRIDKSLGNEVRSQVKELCRNFPIV
jgi:glycine hydroxymethyltransferase